MRNSIVSYSQFLDSRPFLNKVAAFAGEILQFQLPENLFFHNFQHTKETVEAAFKIGKKEALSEEELEMLLIAAWFHDTGFRDEYFGHESASQKIAQQYLSEITYPEEKTQQVLDIIAATKMPQNPQSKLQKIMCDADLYHLSNWRGKSKRRLLRKEWENKLHKKFSDQSWCQVNLEFTREHCYFTNYGCKVLEKRKQHNIAEIEQKLSSLTNNSPHSDSP